MKLSEQWKEGRSKIAPPLPNSSTQPTFEIAAKEDQDSPPPTSGKSKMRPAEPTEAPDDEDEDVIILEGPVATCQRKSPRKKVASTPGKGIRNAALRLRGPRR